MNTGKTLYAEEDLGLDLSNTVSLRQAPSCSGYRPRWRQYSAISASLSAAVPQRGIVPATGDGGNYICSNSLYLL